MKGNDGAGLVAAIKQATAEDLAAIKARIGECEAGLVVLRGELDVLREARRILTRRLGGAPAKATANSDAADNLKARIYDMLAEVGYATSKEIADELGVAVGRVRPTVGRCDWFRRLDSGAWTIAHVGDSKS